MATRLSGAIIKKKGKIWEKFPIRLAGPGLSEETLQSLLKETLGDHILIKRRPKGDFLDSERRPK